MTPRQLRGGAALVTGAAGGLGPFVARALAREGSSLALTGHPRERHALEALRVELAHIGARAEVVVADLLERQDLDGLWERVEEALGPVQIVVHGAGVEMTAAYTDFTREQLEEMVAVNLTAPLLLTRDAVRSMTAHGGGHVVFMSSLAGKLGTPFNEPYSATKAGLVGLTQSLRAEYFGTSVGFSVVSPGFVGGAGMYARMEEAGAAAPSLARATSPEDVSRAVIRAIRGNLPEVIVSTKPMRPVLALAVLAPRLGERFFRRAGTDEVFRRMALVRTNRAEATARALGELEP